MKYYRGEDCIKIFCKDLKDQTMKIINYEKKEMIPLTEEEKDTWKSENLLYMRKRILYGWK